MRSVCLLTIACLLVGFGLSAPIKSKYAIEYHLNPSEKLEKRLETEKESLIHLKEASKLDTDTEKREHQFIKYDHFDEDDDYYGHEDNGYGGYFEKREQTHPKVEKSGQSQYQKKQAVRYEKRIDKQREVSQEIKHVPKMVKAVAHQKENSVDQYKFPYKPYNKYDRTDDYGKYDDDRRYDKYDYDDKYDAYDKYGKLRRDYYRNYNQYDDKYDDQYGRYEDKYYDKYDNKIRRQI
ncbi:hypothetical protein AHF37_02345 [Paragonimus kellicotti]|nr:hypothetical protein AHF37_02345 [Paragonimus kellicotti]